jgi:transcription elongation factor Elf1
LSNKLPSKKQVETPITEKPPRHTCPFCGEHGKVPIYKRTEPPNITIEYQYNLCPKCFIKLITIHCPECEDNQREYSLARDIQRLEITCSTCGTVLASISTEEHQEKRDYTTNRPVDYNDCLEINPDNHNWNRHL